MRQNCKITLNSNGAHFGTLEWVNKQITDLEKQINFAALLYLKKFTVWCGLYAEGITDQ